MGRIESKTLAGMAVALLAGCGGGSDTAPVQPEAAPTTFAAYAARGGELPAAPQLDAVQAAEVAARTRDWAAGQVAAAPGNAFVLPPLHFARVQAVAAAASGSTLAQLRAAVPAPATPAVSAALLAGLQRTLLAGADSTPTTDFIADVTAAPWQALTLRPLDAAALALQPNLRLSVQDVLAWSMAWPQAQVFGGVFEDARGGRVLAQMVRVGGPLKRWSAAGTGYDAMALSAERWLVRITPPAGAGWSDSELAAALAAAQAGVADRALAASPGTLALPLEASFTSAGTEDLRGMDEARNPSAADLRRLDGHGGAYAVLHPASTTLQFKPGWLQLDGQQLVDFVFSPDNRYTSGAVSTNVDMRWGATCGVTDLRPALLALVGLHGRIEMLARLDSSDGVLCSR